MKRTMVNMLSAVVALGLFAGLVGCDLQPEQIKVVAQNAGLFAAVGWIAMDDPEQAEVGAVSSIMDVIRDNAGSVKEGLTYTEVIYPILEEVISSDVVDLQYEPICKAGSLSLLGGIGMLFAANPEWKEQQDLAISVVNSFILGASNGLSMKADDPVMVAARATAGRRAKVFVK